MKNNETIENIEFSIANIENAIYKIDSLRKIYPVCEENFSSIIIGLYKLQGKLNQELFLEMDNYIQELEKEKENEKRIKTRNSKRNEVERKTYGKWGDNRKIK